MKERDMNVAAQTEWLETFKKNCGSLWNSVWITCEWWVPSHINFKCGINVWLRQKHWSALKFSFRATRNDDGRTKFYWTRRQMHKHHHQKFTAALPTASTGQTSRNVRGRNNGRQHQRINGDEIKYKARCLYSFNRPFHSPIVRSSSCRAIFWHACCGYVLYVSINIDTERKMS